MYRFHLSILCTCKNQGALNISKLNLLDLECPNLFVKSLFNCLYFDISSSSLQFIFSLCMIEIFIQNPCIEDFEMNILNPSVVKCAILISILWVGTDLMKISTP